MLALHPLSSVWQSLYDPLLVGCSALKVYGSYKITVIMINKFIGRYPNDDQGVED